MADTLVLGTSASAWGFKSLYPHQLRLYSIKVVHGFGKAETQDRYLLEAPDNARLVKWHNIGFVIRGWEFDSLSGHHSIVR